MRTLITSLQFIFAFVIVLSGLTAAMLFIPVSIPKSGTVFYVPPGSSREDVVIDLAKTRLIRFEPLFAKYARMRGITPRSGEYLLPQGSSPYKIWKQITAGTGRYYRTFTIIPGWTYKQVKTALAKESTIRHFITESTPDENVAAALGDTAHGPEGMFLPETYYYSRDDADLVILKRAYDLMNKKLDEAWASRAPNLPYKNVYEALIVASLIEKEAYLAKEQPIIGGVIVNRLRKNMLLQIDPTVIYGMGDAYQGKIFKKDLTTDTPYNTYTRKGLPPTPIAMPGYNAILAALHPDTHDYLYFVAKGDGSHEFTTNLKSHTDAVKKAADVQAKKAVNTTAAAGDAHAAR